MAAGPGTDASHVVADQSEAFRFLADPAAHPGRPDVRRIDTHAAAIFLAGGDAYKVKRAVFFPFMDYSTLEKRQAACRNEVAINGPHAPGIYLGAVPITRTPAGLSIGGPGEVVEWAVHMRRFDEAATLDQVADRGELTDPMLLGLVDAIVAFQAAAPVRPAEPAVEGLAGYLRQNRDAFAESPDLFPPDRAAALAARMEDALRAVTPLLLERGRKGFVRRCHGDLHLRNVVLLDGRPTLFDAIEFDEAIATCDVLYDVAFLLMDLWDRGLHGMANAVMNRFLSRTSPDNLDGLAALPFFLALRAVIRAKVTAAGLGNLSPDRRPAASAEAGRYFAAAEAFLAPADLRLVAVGGLSGSGKSTLSGRIAPAIGRPPGAVHLRSDVIRKQLAGVAETTHLPPESYTRAASATVYAALRDLSARTLAAGQSVVADAVHARPEERAAIAAVADRAGAAFSGLWLHAPVDVLAARVDGRTGDASDATASVVRQQAAYAIGDIAWIPVDTGGTAEASMRATLEALGLSVTGG